MDHTHASHGDAAAALTPANANRRFECDLCGKTFGLKHDLVQHIKSIHEKESHKCERCLKTFNRKENLRRHQLTCKDPSTEPEKKCDQCGKTFTLKKDLVRHINSIHTKEMYHCEQCLRTFNREFETSPGDVQA